MCRQRRVLSRMPPAGTYEIRTYVNEAYVVPGGLPDSFRQGGRCLGAAVCLTPAAPVRLHRIRNDQLYHRYLGDAFEVLLLYPDRTHRVEVMGTRIASGQRLRGAHSWVEPSTPPGWSELGRGFSVPARSGRRSQLMSSLEIAQRWRGASRMRRTSFADLMSGQQLSQATASRETPIHQR
jgi:Cupin superfamily (DUF985)